MMPTFPLPPLKFRMAGFRRYGFKAGCQTRPSQRHWFAIILRALCCHRDSLLCVRDDALDKHLRASGSAALPQGTLAPVRVMLSRSILTQSGPNRPTRRHIPTSPSRGL